MIPCVFTLFILAISFCRAAPLPSQGAVGNHTDLEQRASHVIRHCKKQGTFALTFDDGPYQYGEEIASYFDNRGLLTTFFVNGNNWDCIYDRADDLIARYQAGHQIGLETALMKILGIKPRMFRPPYGAYDAGSIAILRARGYKVVTWDFDSGDSLGYTVSETIAAYAAAANAYPKSWLAINHETYSSTAHKVVPHIVPQLLAAGYSLVTVGECLGSKPYQHVGKPGTRDGTWTCDGTPGPGDPGRRRGRAV